tara:strand:+ start:198 stop:395 length:198 start_codon:yes stop_codon:yes gene_type:complete
MPLTTKRLLNRVSELADPVYICEVLELTTEDLLERFNDLVETKIDVLREVYDVNTNFEEEGQEDG